MRTTTSLNPNKMMRVLLCILASFAIIFGCSPLSADADVRKSDIVGYDTLENRGIVAAMSPSVDANYVYVCDSDGNVYFERDSETKTNIASITKVMTAIVTLENAKLDETAVVSPEAASIGESSSYLLAGDRVTVENLLKGLMIPSGNDSATVLAEFVGGKILEEAKADNEEVLTPDGSAITGDSRDDRVNAFVWAMNQKAKQLGCNDTLYANSHGLDIGQFAKEMYSSAKDVATICNHAMKNETFRNISKMDGAKFNVERNGQPYQIEVASTDVLIGNYDGACGIKTGFTSNAGACFAGACNRDGKYVYAIVLDSSTESKRFDDAKQLFDWVYDSQVDFPLASSKETAVASIGGYEREVPVVAQASMSSWMDKTVPVTLADPDQTISVSKIFGNVSQNIKINDINGGVKVGDVVGKANFYQNNQVVASVDLVACEDVEGPNLFETIGIGINRVMNNFTGGQNAAETVICNNPPIILDRN